MMNTMLNDKGLYSQSYGFSSSPVWMWEQDHKEGWTLKNWCFQIVVLEKSWESLGLQGDPTQSILKEISPECSLEGLMLKLNLQYFGHLTWRADSLEKTLMLGKTEGKSRRRWQRIIRWLDSQCRLNEHEFEQTVGESGRQKSLVCCSPQSHKESAAT